MTNSKALREAIKNSGIKIIALCNACGVTYPTMQSKIDNKSEFNAREIETISRMIGFSNEERDSIFFYNCG